MSSKLSKLKWTGHVDMMGEKRTPLRTLSCHLSGKKHVSKPRRWSVDNIEWDVRNLGLEGMWTEKATDRIGWRRIVVSALN